MYTKGSYVLLVFLDNRAFISVGRLGTFAFPRGYYLYAGSALGGLRGRINRHLKKQKKLHWHIDYLLVQARIVEVWVVFGVERLECLLAQAALNLPGATIPVAGFGSSDCRCRTHLSHFSQKPELEAFQAAVGQGVTLEEPLSGPDAR